MAVYYGNKKVSGNGFTPYINPTNYHWMIGAIDTGINSRGDDAYEMAKIAGYTGTKEEYSQMLNDFITFNIEESQSVEYPDTVDADTLSGKKAEEFANANHTHNVSDLNGVALEGHTHSVSQVSGVALEHHSHEASDLNGVALSEHTHGYADIRGVAATNHTHSYVDITDTPIENGVLKTYPQDGKSLRNIFVSTTEPTDADGVDGDLWIVLEQETASTEEGVDSSGT